MKQNYDDSVPCHRVIRADGMPSDFNRGGAEKKLQILQSEGAIK
jgi:alkylated DNA nucleotide flippase Atl1